MLRLVPVFWLASAAAAATLKSPDGALFLTAPAGWSAADVKAPTLFRLDGPLHYSAVISRLKPTQYLYNRAALSQSLERLLTRVSAEARTRLELDPKLRHAGLSNGADLDYRLGQAAGRPAMLLGICRFGGDVLLVQVISHHAEADAREILGTLELARAAPSPAEAPAPRDIPWGGLVGFWAVSLGAVLLAMLYWAIQLRKPSRFQKKKANLRR